MNATDVDAVSHSNKKERGKFGREDEEMKKNGRKESARQQAFV